MKRTACALVLLATVGGCVSTDRGPNAGGNYGWGWAGGAPSVPGVQGPWGQPVAITAGYSPSPRSSETAHATMTQGGPIQLVQHSDASNTGSPSAVQQPSEASAHGPGCASPFGAAFHRATMPMLGHPAGAVAAVGALTGPSPQPFPTKRTEVRFVGPERMRVSWSGTASDGTPAVGHIDVPGRYNFVQGAVYRLKLSDIPSLPGVDLYPTLEVVPANARTEAFLAHSAVPVSFTNEDFEQVQAGNYLIKVIYLPNPQFQDLVAAGPDEIVSSRLEPGADPIAEAHRRGNILLVIRVGNIDLELANSPPMDAPSPFAPSHGMAPGMHGSAMVPGMPISAIWMGNPGPPPTGQTIADVAAPSKNATANAAADANPLHNQTTDVISADQMQVSRRRWWFIGRSDK
jgi:hypothetical protein